MLRHAHLSLGCLAVLTALPLAWLACGGGKKPAESPSEETSSDDGGSSASSASSSAATAGSSDTSTMGAGGGSSGGGAASAASASASASAAPPPAPAFGGSPCGQCVDTACAKQLAACGKNSDCQGAIDAVHSCGSDKGAGTCISAASAPATPKPMKLFDAYTKCAAKATASKACNASCQ